LCYIALFFSGFIIISISVVVFCFPPFIMFVFFIWLVLFYPFLRYVLWYVLTCSYGCICIDVMLVIVSYVV